MKFILCFIIWVTSTSLAYAQPIETVTAQSEQSEKIMLLTRRVNELENELSSLSYDAEKYVLRF
ncbi:hypothetical protein I6F50_10425 [Pseudoalteromonas sp. NZS127_1]|uniref:hypothetical protein n=1 Tax=Pseudoalteromonas sp. NZS127_1 TaxID=2792074 RepID=UPI0018CDFB46|nr:hypothetical protein [Pseudoalteromonas sp. NZS127_1]MBG9995478.1 hypothetical protein [Pseudoalteromonas sp. NZS127_1]